MRSATITNAVKRAQVVAMTGRDRWHDFYGWHDAWSTPFAGGSRLFIRTSDALCCFGDKSQLFVPARRVSGR